MGSFIFKQPNGLYARWSSIVDNITDFNMTEEEYKILKIEDSIKSSDETLKKYVHNYEEVTQKIEDYIEYLKSLEDDEKDKEDCDKMEKDYKELLELMNKVIPSNDIEQDFYKTSFNLIEKLCCCYDYDWEEKKYSIQNHPEHMKEILPKLKEILNIIEKYEQ